MGGIITKLSIGTLILSVVIVFTVLFMTEIGNEYGVGNDLHLQKLADTDFEQKAQQIQGLSSNASQAYLSDGIDNQATDEAQLAGSFDANNIQLGNFEVLENALTSINEILPINSQVFNLLTGGLLVILLAAAGLFVVFKVMP